MKILKEDQRTTYLYLIATFVQVFDSNLFLLDKYFNDLCVGIFSFFRDEHHECVVLSAVLR